MAWLEVAQAASELISAAKDAEELVSGAYSAGEKAYKKLKSFFTKTTPHYTPLSSAEYAHSLTWVPLLYAERLLLRMQAINFSLYYDREFARSLFQVLCYDASHHVFTPNGIFRDDVSAIPMSRPKYSDLMSGIARSLSLTRHPTADEITNYRTLYYDSISKIFATFSDHANVYNRAKFELEFQLLPTL